MDLGSIVSFVQGSGLTIVTDALALLGALASLFHVFHQDGASALFDKLAAPLQALKSFLGGKQ